MAIHRFNTETETHMKDNMITAQARTFPLIEDLHVD